MWPSSGVLGQGRVEAVNLMCLSLSWSCLGEMKSGSKALDSLGENNFPLCALFICIVNRLWSPFWDGVPGPAEIPALGFISVPLLGENTQSLPEKVQWLCKHVLLSGVGKREEPYFCVCITLTLAFGQDHEGVWRTMALTSDQARTEQTQVTIRARDISAP